MFVRGSHAFAMFPRPLYVSALFRKCVLLDHVVCPWLFCVVSRHGRSEEESPASAYLRAVPKCVAGFVYNERGKSTKDTQLTPLPSQHTHTMTHIYMYTHMHRCTHTMVIQHFAILQLQIMHKHHLPS